MASFNVNLRPRRRPSDSGVAPIVRAGRSDRNPPAGYDECVTHFGLVFDEQFKRHVPAHGHPERPLRLDAVAAGLEQAGVLRHALRVPAEPVGLELLERLHARPYIQRLEQACRDGRPFIDDPDSSICRETYAVALRAAGAVVEAARRIGSGDLKRAFCAVRPPGHHAERDRSMGFCMFNNVALAARVLRDEFGLERLAILDWDVHHGNSTQHAFESDPSVLFISLHGHPDFLYPGTGYAEERGVGAGAGYTLNVPLLPGTTDKQYLAEFETHVLPAMQRFEPQAILISAGFDAHADDPLGNLSLSDEAYRFMLRQVLRLADSFAAGRVLSVLEGGYNLDVLRRCVADHVRMLAEQER